MWMLRRPPAHGRCGCGEPRRTLTSGSALLPLAWDTTLSRQRGKAGRKIAVVQVAPGPRSYLTLVLPERPHADRSMNTASRRAETVYPRMHRTSRAFTIPSS